MVRAALWQAGLDAVMCRASRISKGLYPHRSSARGMCRTNICMLVMSEQEGCLLNSEDCVLDGVEINAQPGNNHECTLIYLHGCSCSASEYLDDGYCLAWLPGGDRAPGLRAVLPNANFLDQPWGERLRSWHGYCHSRSNRVGDLDSLEATRRRISRIAFAEVARFHGEGHRVFLGGASQGCTVALDVYFREACRLRLGGFVGSVGFIPNDHQGFPGASRALERLILDKEQAQRPVWLQCATDDNFHVPWRSVVTPSLRRARRLPGLQVREVSGRGHILDEWEGHIINDFLKKYAPFACK